MATKLPPLPSQRELSRWLADLNQSLEDGGADVRLYCEGAGWPDSHWTIGCDWGHGSDDWPGPKHTECVPEGGKFDATAVARRLLFAAKQEGY